MNAGFEPELKPLPVNVADYDVIAVGTPTWWYTMAPAVKAFLHGQNFAGKTVVPFMTNGGDHLETPESKINAWAQSVKALL